jgi:5-methylcytosine-specific restriction endonuclease McrA
MAKRIGPPRVGHKKLKRVSKVRRTSTQAYGSRNEWQQTCVLVKTRDGYKCRQCPRRNFLQVDHIIPVAKGGRTIMSNLWTLCDICHSKRPGHGSAKGLILSRRNKSTKK